MQQLQQRSYAPPPPLNAGFAYRVRDSDVNVSGGFSQGRGQLQVSAVDDDTLMEVIRARVGFRTVEVRSGRLLVNGVAVTLAV